jgi:hypothetical protein
MNCIWIIKGFPLFLLELVSCCSWLGISLSSDIAFSLTDIELYILISSLHGFIGQIKCDLKHLFHNDVVSVKSEDNHENTPAPTTD